MCKAQDKSIVISNLQEKLFENITAQTILFTVSAYLFQAGINLGTLKIAMNIQNDNEAEFKEGEGFRTYNKNYGIKFDTSYIFSLEIRRFKRC